MRFYRFNIKNKDGFTHQITRRADSFIKLLGQLSVLYPEHRIDYIG